MIVKKSKRFVGFLKTTAIGGLLFLLPLAVIGFLVGQIVPFVTSAITELRKDEVQQHIPELSAWDITMIVVLSIVFLLLLCFAAGLVARWSIGRRVSTLFEKNILLLFPRYAIIKDQMADTIGGAQNKPKMKGVVVQMHDHQRIGFETERSADGKLATVYLPGSPDTWAGRVVIVPTEQLSPLSATFGETVTTCEQLGRGSFALLDAKSSAAAPAAAERVVCVIGGHPRERQC